MSGEAWYVVGAPPAAGTFVLDGPEGRHAATVRRTRPGERLFLTDGAGTRWSATALEVDAKGGSVTLRVERAEQVPPPALGVTVVQALPKGDRSDLAVDLLTEAGVDTIVPWQAARCVARWSGPKAERGVAKWRTVAREAGKQSRRPWLPVVAELAGTADVCALIESAELACVLHEAGSVPFTSLRVPTAGEVLLIVGPEGGVAPEELSAFAAAGAVPVRLGPEVLRTSTAGVVALGALGALTDRWNSDRGNRA